ncbi:methyltransferase domain protein [Ceratobasidium sp. AG-Ba]|nr:methyltransferase domain protein [Ceratobasidium sp. AG-Ba]
MAERSDGRPQSTSRRSHSMSTAQRPSQFTMFSNTTHKHPSTLRRITARVRAHFDSSNESDVTRRPRALTHPEQLYTRHRVLSEPHSDPNTYPRGFRRAAGTHPPLYDANTHPEPGIHDLWMGSRAFPRYGLRTPRPLSALDPARSLTRPASSESLSDAHTTAARIGHSVSATSSFVMLDTLDSPPVAGPATAPMSTHRTQPTTGNSLADADSEWVIRNGQRHLRSQAPQGIEQYRRERKLAEVGSTRRERIVVYPVDYSPDTLASHAFAHLLNSAPDPPCVKDKQPQRCLDLGCGGGEWIRDAARRWPKCEFVGMDLVLMHRGQLGSTRQRKAPQEQRVSWVKGDFLADALPFPSASFDYVHLRDVARAIPHLTWSSLMSQVARVLRPGGVMDLTVEDIIFPILPRSLTAGPTETEISNYTQTVSGRGRRLSNLPADARPSGLSVSDGAGSGDVSRGASGDTVRRPPTRTGESAVLESLPRDRSSEGSSRQRAGSTTPLETISRSRDSSTPKPRSRSRDMFRSAFSDGEGVRAGLGRILRGSRRSAASPPRGGEAKSPIQASFFIPCVSTATLQGSASALAAPGVIQPQASVPGVRVSTEDARPTQASLGLGVPSFGMALSSAALGSALSLRSMDEVSAPRGSVTSLHPPQACANIGYGHPSASVVSFHGLLSPPLTPPRKELLVAEANMSGVGSDLVLDSDHEVPVDARPTLGHDYELLEELFCAVYNRRGIHLQPTVVLPGLVQSMGAFGSVEVGDATTVPMPQHCNAQSDATRSPPTPDTSPKNGPGSVAAQANRNGLTLQHALQGVLSVREAMWEELVVRRDLADSPDERVRHERMRFEEMVRSYAKAVRALIDVPNMLVSTIGWRRPVPREQPPELKWATEESRALRADWAKHEAVHGLAGYSTYSRRARSIIAVKA